MGAITSVFTRLKDIICCTGADVNTQNSDGNTALHLAVLESKDVNHVKTLIDTGTDVNTQNSEGNTALHLAVLESKDVTHVKTLIDGGSDVNTKNSDGNTALHLCLLNTNRISLARLDSLVNESASQRDVQPLENHTVTVNEVTVNEVMVNEVMVNEVTVDEVTVDEVTVNEDLLEDYDIAEILIDKGADLSIQNNDGNTPLHLALIHSKPSKLVQELCDSSNKQSAKCMKMCRLASLQSDMCKLVKKMIDKGADVGKQNNEGNTALHLALSSELKFFNVYERDEKDVISCVQLLEIKEESTSIPYHKTANENFEKLLKILLITRETINIRNRLGMDPIQMTIDFIKRKGGRHQKELTLLTLVPLLHLEYEEHFTYSDCHGNTLLHLLLVINRYDASIIKSVDPTYLKFNVQNKVGNTPMHTAPVMAIAYILSNCSKVNLFVRNKRNETFLHTIFKFQYLFEKDLKQFLQGQCNYCSKEDVKKLLRGRDIAGNTPLHILLTNDKAIISTDLIKLFYEAGADLNACNTNKESILHCLVRNGKKICIKFAIEHGAELNVQNAFGESPIFVAKEREVVRFLVNSGADLNICNKSGQNLLLSEMYNIRFFDEIYIKYLVQNFSLKVKDIHGNNILHYVAWHGLYIESEESCDKVNILLEAGAEIEPDALGQLPCYIAHQMGHVKLARRLCKCENTEHLDDFTFTKQKMFVDQYEIRKLNFSSPLPFDDKRRYFANNRITDVLEMPFIGSVKFEVDSEAKEMRSCIVNIINEICKRLGYENDLLKNRVVQAGSVGENTKVGLPNEFDFTCVFDVLSKACYVEAVPQGEPACAVVKLKNEFIGHRCQSLFDENYYFSYKTVFGTFMTALRDVVQSLDLYSHHNIIYKKIFHKDVSPNVELYFVWTGRKYKGMEIKVDLVPAIQIKGWWPPGTRLDSLACNTEQTEQLRKDGAVLLFKTSEMIDITHNNSQGQLHISVFTAEKVHLAALPPEARDAYRIAKILWDERVCPRDENYNFHRTYISSYMLKNCMFYVLDNPIESMYDCVCKIFRYLHDFADKEILPSYVYPRCNSFASFFDTQERKKLLPRRIHSHIILNMIGSTEEILPNDLEKLFQFIRGLRKH